MVLFVPFHLAFGLLHKMYCSDPVSTFQLWLRACHLKKLRMIGPIHVTIHLLRSLKLDVHEDGSASFGSSTLNILVRRRSTFAGVESGVDRNACLNYFKTLKDPCGPGVLEHFLCGGHVPIGEYGDFRPEESHCQEASQSMVIAIMLVMMDPHHLLNASDASELVVGLSDLASGACLVFPVVVVSASGSSTSASSTSGCASLSLGDSHVSPSVGGDSHVGCSSSSAACSPVGVPPSVGSRSKKLQVPSDIFRSGDDFSGPAAAVLQIENHEVVVIDCMHRLQCIKCLRRHPWSNRSKFRGVSCVEKGAPVPSTRGRTYSSRQRVGRIGVPIESIRSGPDFSAPARSSLDIRAHQVQIVDGCQKLQCVICLRRLPWPSRSRFIDCSCVPCA
eukprot:6398718-Amphidinium_carterae.3